MNENSELCKFIAANPEAWAQRLTEEYDIKIKREGELAIFNYSIGGDFYNPIVQEARGIIIDVVDLEVVCWPFRKFGNHTEGYADKIDWESARVQEKIDGSIIKLWYHKKRRVWTFSTNGVIFAKNARLEKGGGCYGEVILSTENMKDIAFWQLNEDYTYIFELVSPQTRIVIPYEKAMLYHLGTRNNITGEEYDLDIGIQKPKSYPLTSLEDCIYAAKVLNKTDAKEVNLEGFVVVDKFWHRVKVKSPAYLTMHHVFMTGDMTKKECVYLLLHEREKLNGLYERFPALEPILKYYDYRIAELRQSADALGVLAQKLYEEYSGDRKAVAGVLSKHHLAMVGFACLNKEKSGKEILAEMTDEKICKMLPDYVAEDFSSLFI